MPQQDINPEEPMVTVEDYILGGSGLHDRLCAMAEIMAKLVSSAPRAVSMAQLEQATGRPSKELTRLCGCLWRADLLLPGPRAGESWSLACEPSEVTLEDVFRCIVAEQQACAKPAAKPRKPECPRGDVDLLVMQAMIAINQSVLKHLRQFSLDRLKISATGMFPETRRKISEARLDDAAEIGITIAARDANLVLPVQLSA
jgi:DNA-binding IscR family transcriptional regulator